uniref:Inositol 2-dehydrogenase n=1 Tax=Compsopogon caeruleus TaxID=31354 RepID=A0A7S1TDP2_9RHOD|eukprot:CAMPEP_0184680664 /NCGR_PEP_ID=MMETSP0312-20130426/3563_1 /TAXON_ID=31354 /ORGANISM="Compsopogon coeruleus, Strain SAG 36.94" /LENGTH=338 /DNA_ID=CAMNT_0027130937 /DNA_START=57 /DNA_END=1073 /DNA_ORIENTATION=-
MGGGDVVRVGLIGCGRIGQVHCRALEWNPKADVVIAADFFLKAAESCAEKWGIPRAVQDWKEVVASPEVDAVVICSPSDTHCEIIIAAANAGKQIFCEKPIDYDLARIDEALSAVQSHGVKLQLGFQRRFDVNFVRVRDAVQNGEIGTPYMVNIISRDPAPPPIDYLKQSGGLFFDMMIHDFDMSRFVLGSEAVEISAVASSFDPAISEIGDVTSAIVTIKFENGAIGAIQCCRKAVYGYDQRIEVLGSSGAVETGNNYPNTAIISSDAAIRRDLPLNFFMDRYKEAYAAEMEAFIDMVRTGTDPVVGGIDGRIPVVMAYAAAKSLKEGRPVKLSEIK